MALIDCTARGADILRIKVPTLWNVALDNSVDGRASLTEGFTVGAAALTADSLDYFDDFITIGRSKHPVRNFESYFDFQLVIDVSTDSQMENTREIRFGLKELTLKPRLQLD